MARQDVRREDVLAAIKEFDNVGRDAFLDEYKMGKATSYQLHHDGQKYDSKAIFAAAHGHHPGLEPLKSSDFSGGKNDAAKYLRRLGFDVYPATNPDWTRDELILACDLVRKNGWKQLGKNDPLVRELSKQLHAMPIHPIETRTPTFRNPDGVAYKTLNIASLHPGWTGSKTNTGKGDQDVLDDFLAREDEMRQVAQLIREGIDSGEFVQDEEIIEDVDDLGGEASEGRLLERKHFARERNRKRRDEKIQEHLRTQSKLACETCGFDFKATYGDRGEGYIECHHVVPLHVSGVTKTRLKDLILICANCHRMIHRGSRWLTPDELRERLAAARKA